MEQLAQYAIALRREIHRHPEIGFDLKNTIGIVRRELDAIGIPYTVDEFGPSSIVATVNGEKTGFTIGLRADMDALPIQEATGLPFASEVPGVMHACGHDVHTSNLLAVTKKLWDIRDRLRCRVKLIFTPAEEYITPGCKAMVENGLMDGIDCAITTHVSSTYPVGTVALCHMSTNANSIGFTVEFFGKTSHVARQERGVDAIAIAVSAYQAIELMVAKEFQAVDPRIVNIGVFEGGKTNNIICDYCRFFGSIRAWSDEVSDKLQRRIREICEGVAAMQGGSAKVTINKFLPYVAQHPTMVEEMRASAAKVIGPENILDHERTMGGEDFGFLSRKKPCVLFQLGTRGADPNTGCALHNDHFDVDEACFRVSIPTMVQFVLDHQDGIQF